MPREMFLYTVNWSISAMKHIRQICTALREEWEGSSHISYNPVDHLLIFTHFLALVDRTLLLSNYLAR